MTKSLKSDKEKMNNKKKNRMKSMKSQNLSSESQQILTITAVRLHTTSVFKRGWLTKIS